MTKFKVGVPILTVTAAGQTRVIKTEVFEATTVDVSNAGALLFYGDPSPSGCALTRALAAGEWLSLERLDD